MNKSFAVIAVAVALLPFNALAQERAGDAALGALSGIVLGPVGIVAGAVVGYTAGPSIANAWGIRRHRTHRGYATRHSARAGAVMADQGTVSQMAPASTPPAAPPAPASAARAAPVPMQGFE